jgi:putative addiction module component (TIGR02574 family)
MTREALLAEALALPREARAELLHELMESLDAPATPDTEAKWAAEVTRRIELYHEGKLATESAEEAVSSIRRELAERRG